MVVKNITVPARLDARSLPRLLDQLRFLGGEDPPAELIFYDASWLAFIEPIGTVLLANSLTLLSHKWPRLTVELTLPRNVDVRAYMSRMNVLANLGIRYVEGFTRHDRGGRFLELTALHNEEDCDTVAQEISELLKIRCRLNRDQTLAIRTAIAEVTNNIFHHAESPTLGLTAAQFYPATGMILVAICDAGIGIPRALTRNQEMDFLKTRPAEALKAAIKYKVTSRPEHNSGFGLYITTELIRRSNGLFSLQCGGDKLVGIDGGLSGYQVPPWFGTIVHLGFPVNVPYSVNDIYEEMARAGDVTQTVEAITSRWK